MLNFTKEDTICATITPHGFGGVSVIRVSGKDAFSIVKKSLSSFQGVPESHRVYLCNFINTHTNKIIDEVLITYFANGKSFTGEESVEIASHGSPIIVQEILNQLCALGCRMAERGEFSFRAFMNQRLDLTQAEAIHSLIHSKSKRAARLSVQHLKGALSLKLNDIENQLTFVLANLEASIDFSTEDIEILDKDQNISILEEIKDKIDKILESYHQGKKIQEGFQFAIVGKPNAGKSSLLNALLKENKAIVSEEPGTTRDIVEASLNINGYLVKLVDTAGIHQSTNKIEKMGIQKSQEAIQNSDYVFYIVDPRDSALDLNILELLKDKEHDIWLSKGDLKIPSDLTKNSFHSLDENGLKPLVTKITSIINELDRSEDASVYQARHYELFTRLQQRVEKTLEMMKNGASEEFLILELQEGLQALFEVTGKRFDDEVMDRVFKEFCIGK